MVQFIYMQFISHHSTLQKVPQRYDSRPEMLRRVSYGCNNAMYRPISAVFRSTIQFWDLLTKKREWGWRVGEQIGWYWLFHTNSSTVLHFRTVTRWPVTIVPNSTLSSLKWNCRLTLSWCQQGVLYWIADLTANRILIISAGKNVANKLKVNCVSDFCACCRNGRYSCISSSSSCLVVFQSDTRKSS